MFFDAVGYNSQTEAYEESATADGLTNISGTQVRDMLRAREDFPAWFMRDEVQNMLRQRIDSGTELFH